MEYKPIPAGAYVSVDIPDNVQQGDTIDLKVLPDEGYLLDLISLAVELPDGTKGTLTGVINGQEVPLYHDNIAGPAKEFLSAGDNMPELKDISVVHLYIHIEDPEKAKGGTATMRFAGKQVKVEEIPQLCSSQGEEGTT